MQPVGNAATNRIVIKGEAGKDKMAPGYREQI
jgi:hypothetical protein